MDTSDVVAVRDGGGVAERFSIYIAGSFCGGRYTTKEQADHIADGLRQALKPLIDVFEAAKKHVGARPNNSIAYEWLDFIHLDDAVRAVKGGPVEDWCDWCGNEARIYRCVRSKKFQACNEHRHHMPQME